MNARAFIPCGRHRTSLKTTTTTTPLAGPRNPDTCTAGMRSSTFGISSKTHVHTTVFPYTEYVTRTENVATVENSKTYVQKKKTFSQHEDKPQYSPMVYVWPIVNGVLYERPLWSVSIIFNILEIKSILLRLNPRSNPLLTSLWCVYFHQIRS